MRTSDTRRATKRSERMGVEKTRCCLVPVPITLKLAPDSILRHISCKCKKGCERNCGCRKAGLHCSPICTSCEGLCENVEPPEDINDIDEEETEERDREQTEERCLHDAGGMSNLTIYFVIIHLSLRYDHKLFSHHLFHFPDEQAPTLTIEQPEPMSGLYKQRRI